MRSMIEEMKKSRRRGNSIEIIALFFVGLASWCICYGMRISCDLIDREEAVYIRDVWLLWVLKFFGFVHYFWQKINGLLSGAEWNSADSSCSAEDVQLYMHFANYFAVYVWNKWIAFFLSLFFTYSSL